MQPDHLGNIMRARAVQAAFASLWLALAALQAPAAELDHSSEAVVEPANSAPPYAREMTIRYRLDAAARLDIRYHETITIISPAGLSELREVEIARRVLGGPPENVTVRVLAADGSQKIAFAPRIPPHVVRPRVALRGLAIGDRIEIEAARPAIPGAFPVSALRAFPRRKHYVAARIELVAPADLTLHHETRGFEFEESVEAGERRLVWRMQAPAGSVGPEEPPPRVAFSTFRTRRALGEALAARLALPADEVGLLARKANEIVAAAAEDAQAEALLAWLVRTVAVEPYEAEEEALVLRTPGQVLAERSGNHIEVANLLVRLFEARGLRASLLLTNRRSGIGQTRIGVPIYNASLVHLPVADIYVDPVAGTFTRAYVHPAFAGKLALEPGVAEPERRLPKPSPRDSGIRTIAEMTIQQNGDVDGHSRIIGFGAGAPLVDEVVRQLPTADQTRLSRALLERQLLSGRARLARAAASGSNSIDVDIAFRLSANRTRDGSIRVPLSPGPRLTRRPVAAFIAALREDTPRPLPCSALSHHEDLVFHLPATGIRYQAPESRVVESEHARYAVHYELTDHTLRVERRLDLRYPGIICSPEILADIAPVVRFANFDQSRRITILGEDE